MCNFLFVNVILGQNFVPDTDEVKQKPSLFSVAGKNLLGIVSWILFFVLRHLCPVRTRRKCVILFI